MWSLETKNHNKCCWCPTASSALPWPYFCYLIPSDINKAKTGGIKALQCRKKETNACDSSEVRENNKLEVFVNRLRSYALMLSDNCVVNMYVNPQSFLSAMDHMQLPTPSSTFSPSHMPFNSSHPWFYLAVGTWVHNFLKCSEHVTLGTFYSNTSLKSIHWAVQKA